jgi:predicted MFS family arabinose efflux permease
LENIHCSWVTKLTAL